MNRLASPLPGSLEAPETLKAEYAAWRWAVAWQYGPEALTYRLSSASGDVRYLKIAEDGVFPTLEAEAARMRWARDHLPVPEILSQGSAVGTSWLVTRGLPGRDGTDPFLTTDPRRLVSALARGLRAFHEAPTASCPFDFRLDSSLALARRRLAEGRILPDRDFHPEFQDLSAEEAILHLEATRPEEGRIVVCHGDYCLPNILIQDGVATGFVDLGELGVADQWWDLAVATWSITWNLGPGWEDLFLEEYGVQRDPARQAFYRLLYDVVS